MTPKFEVSCVSKPVRESVRTSLHKTCISTQMSRACPESFETGPESIQICGLNHATSIVSYVLTYSTGGGGGSTGSTVVKLQTSPVTVFGGLNSSTRQ
jgi:hypothetical protein